MLRCATWVSVAYLSSDYQRSMSHSCTQLRTDEDICSTWDVSAGAGLSLGNNIAVGCPMRAVASKSRQQRVRSCTDVKKKLKVAIYIIRQLQGADRILRADVHPVELCERGSKTVLRGSGYRCSAINCRKVQHAQRHHSYI